MTNEEISGMISKHNVGQQAEEMTWFYREAEKINPKVVVEIGIYAGGNLKLLSTLIKDKNGLVVGMDYDFSKWKQYGNWDLNSGLCPICLLDGDSHSNETKDKLIKLLNGKDIDLLFIDGDHSFDGCKLDFDMYGQLVRPGGIIAIHDTQMHRRPDEPAHIRKCGEFFDILPEPKYEKHIADRNWDGYGIGFIYKI